MYICANIFTFIHIPLRNMLTHRVKVSETKSSKHQLTQSAVLHDTRAAVKIRCELKPSVL